MDETLGLKPVLIPTRLRGVEVPLFHGCVSIREFFGSLLNEILIVPLGKPDLALRATLYCSSRVLVLDFLYRKRACYADQKRSNSPTRRESETCIRIRSSGHLSSRTDGSGLTEAQTNRPAGRVGRCLVWRGRREASFGRCGEGTGAALESRAAFWAVVFHAARIRRSSRALFGSSCMRGGWERKALSFPDLLFGEATEAAAEP
jgi:hypothetical protein